MSNNKKLSLIVAVCNDNGIGIEGRLPWNLKREMSYFKRITTTSNDGKHNAVIMGRKTWQSIPLKYRPLSDRINVVLSRSLSEVPEGAHHLFHSLKDSVEELSKDNSIDKLFVIGGQDIYKEAIDWIHLQYIYITRIEADFRCDAFFPQINTEEFADITNEDKSIPQEIQEENGIQYKYYLFKRFKSINN